MWSPTSRRQHSRAALRYGSDLTDAEWAILEPLLPPPCACGRKRKWPMRRIVEAILFIMRAGCAWDMLPDGFPPFLTVIAGSPGSATTAPGSRSTITW